MSIKRIAKELGVAYGTAWNYAKDTKGTANALFAGILRRIGRSRGPPVTTA